MKTVKEWLQELPDGYRERALAQCLNCDVLVESLDGAIARMISWEHTMEGEDFWADVYWVIRNEGDLIRLPKGLGRLDLITENAQLKARIEEL